MRAPPRRPFYPFPALYVTPVLAAAALSAFYMATRNSAPVQTGSVQVAGSETMRPAVSACAIDFMTRHPRASIVVNGNGSGDGVTLLLHGRVDVGMVSRDLSPRELNHAAEKGVKLAVAALDGVSIIVHRSNSLAVLDLVELRGIFTGQTTNWPDGTKILSFAHADGTGAAVLFVDRVLGDASYTGSVQRLPTNEAIVAEVAKQPAAIGYAALGAAHGGGDSIRIVGIRADPRSPPVVPNAETLRSGAYPLTRKLAFGTVGMLSDVTRAFVDFCAGPAGRNLLEKAGYVAVLVP